MKNIFTSICYINEKSRFQIGTSYQHFVESKTPLKDIIYPTFAGIWTVHLNGKLGIGNHFSFNPSLLFASQNNNKEGLVGGSFGYHFHSNSNSNTEFSDAIYIGYWHEPEYDMPNIVLGADIGKFSLNATYESIGYDELLQISVVYKGLTKINN